MTFKIKKVKLDLGEISLREWTNQMDNDCTRRAVQKIGEYEGNKTLFTQESEVWRISYAVFLGEGPLKGKTLEETYANIQALPISESNKLAKAYMDFAKEMSGEEVKKKLESPSGTRS